MHEATGLPVVVTFSCGNLAKVAEHLREKFPNLKFIFCADDDHFSDKNHGLIEATKAAALVNGIVVKPEFDNPRPKDATDFNDMALLHGIESVKIVINKALYENKKLNASNKKPLPDPLPPVITFDPEMVPEDIRSFIMDVSNRQQSPPDFIAVSTLCSIAAVVGRKYLIRPKQNDDWTITPNLWGAIIGRPSAMKSPCLKEALRPLQNLEKDFAKQYEKEKQDYEIDLDLLEVQKKENKIRISRLLKEGKRGEARELLKNQKNNFSINKPIRNRIIVNDASVEKLGEILSENPNGVIHVRDELSGFLSKIQKEEFQSDRAFYLESFNGDSRHACDRISRGTIEIESCTLSFIGGIQPSKIAPLINNAINGKADDGLIQRFQLTVWPDESSNWKWNDELPNINAYKNYQQIITDLHNIKFEPSSPQILNFTPEAQELFIEWMQEIQSEARSETTNSLLESHMLKMPKTIASLALLFELISGGRDAVSDYSLVLALEWSDYLLSHAKRLYSLGINQDITGARLLLKRKNKLNRSFTVRDIYRKGWGINSAKHATDAIQCLIDHGYLIACPKNEKDAAGRPTIVYTWIE